MNSFITQLDDDKKIVLLKSNGMWCADNVLLAVKDAFALNPDYLIWDPTEMIFPVDHLKSYEESSEARQEMADLIASEIHEGRLLLYLIIQRKATTTFESIRGISRSVHVEDKVRYVKSLEEAKIKIADHQHDRQWMLDA